MYQKSKGVPQTMQRENGKDLGSGIDRGVFGNDNEATNEIAGEMFTFIANEIESYRSKIEPEMLNSENGIMQMMALLKSMCSLGIFHVQFNVIDRETLLAVQERPEEYRGLLIRVAGYTAYFTELGKDVQDEIIARTEQESLYGCSVE